MKRISAIVFTILVVLLFCEPSSQPQSGNATVTGRVLDPLNAAIPNTTITVLNVDTQISHNTTTNNDGLFSVVGLIPGNYRIEAAKPGFKTVIKPDIVLHVQDVVAINFNMILGSVAESITVEGGVPLINAESAAVSTVVDRRFVENIPLNGRSFQSLITLTPGVNVVPASPVIGNNSGEFSINGQRTEANYYTVDGVAANTGTASNGGAYGASGNIPGETALGTTQSLVSIDALQEFRIQTSTYSAEYGRTPGGQISFVTRSGTNGWHGSAFDYLRNGAFDANNWFNNAEGLPKTSERQNDFGGVLGGPLIIPHLYNGRNGTFFFFSYEGLRVSTPQPAQTTFVPDLAMRQTAPLALQPLLNAFPVPNGPENGTTGMAQFTAAFSNPGTIDATSIRLDHSFNSKFTVFGRYSNSPSQILTRGPGLNSLAAPFDTSTNVRVLTLGTTNLFTTSVTNQFRFNLTWNDGRSRRFLDTFGGAIPFDINGIKDANGQPTPGVDSFQVFLNFGGGSLYRLEDLRSAQRQINVVETVNFSLGRHSLKFGGDFRRLTTPLTLARLAEFGAFSSEAEVQQNSTAPGSTQISSDSSFPIGPVYNNFSLFAQDEWRATPRLNLSLGLRWELNPPPTDAYGNPPYTLDQVADLSKAVVLPKGAPLWKTTYGNFAPRFGAAYRLRQTPGQETIIRGGFGVFYDLGNTYASQGYQGVGVGVINSLSNAAFPFTATQLTLPPPSAAPPYNAPVYAFDPNLQLPYTLQWSAAVEQALGKSQALTVSYVGSAGRRLLMTVDLFPGQNGNSNFASFGLLNLTTNKPTSDYNALQVQFQRRLARGLQAMASYTFAHSIDEASANILSFETLRASSDFDVRHNFQAAVTYDLPGNYRNAFAGAMLGHWSLDTRVSGRSAFPFDVSGGIFIDPAGTLSQLRADIVPGQPIYISDPGAPGGRRINFNAFTQPTTAEVTALQFGNAPRNFLRAFVAWQVDAAVRREFPIHERLKLQFRAEAFNLFNHPIFGAIQNSLTSGAAVFGRATGTSNNQLGGLNPLYQPGGPRSLQLALKLVF